MEPLETREKAGALWVTLRRPPLNVLDLATLRAVTEALAPLPGRRDLKAVVFRSAIDGTFSAGADVADHARERAPEMLRVFHGLVRLLNGLPQASIAAVDGRCLGGGCELALVCDMVLATARATFGQPEIDLACFPPVAATWLPRLAPRAAFAMVLGGEPLAAPQALAAGLITAVVDDADAAAEAWAARLQAKSGVALALARRALRLGATGAFEPALAEAERIYIEELLRTDDAAEGVAAFLDKRRPRWSDR